MAFVVGVVVYRIVLLQVLYRVDGMKQYASILTFTTAATLNLIVILILSYVSAFISLFSLTIRTETVLSCRRN